MIDFDVQRCTRRCAATDRELRSEEVFYSVLQSEGSEVVRRDYCEEAWTEPPKDVIGWWKSQMPSPNANKMHWAPNDVMLHYFQKLEDDTAKADVRYILALLLIRRRIVRLDDRETDAEGREWMVVYCPKNETEYKVATVPPSGDRINEIQDELARLLFADAA
jgi:hypothetical protein